MTVIAAVARDGHVHVAADTQVNGARTWYGVEKARTVAVRDAQDTPCGHAVLAHAGRMGPLDYVLDIAKLTLDPVPERDNGRALDRWAIEVAVEIAKACSAAVPPLLGADTDDNTVTPGYFLLAYAGRLWELSTHGALPVTDGITAIGSGGQIALGALHTALFHNATPEDAVIEAVAVACRFDPYCGTDEAGPVTIAVD